MIPRQLDMKKEHPRNIILVKDDAHAHPHLSRSFQDTRMRWGYQNVRTRYSLYKYYSRINRIGKYVFSIKITQW